MANCPKKVLGNDNDVVEMVQEEVLPLDLDAPSDLPMVDLVH